MKIGQNLVFGNETSDWIISFKSQSDNKSDSDWTSVGVIFGIIILLLIGTIFTVLIILLIICLFQRAAIVHKKLRYFIAPSGSLLLTYKYTDQIINNLKIIFRDVPENESIQMSENTVYNKTSEPSDLLYSTVEDSPFPIYAEIRVKKPGI